MKKITILLAIIVTILCLNKKTTVTIPKDTIRFRVIANSNSEKDQQIKKEVAYNLNKNIQELKFIPKDVDSSRRIIKNALPTFKETIDETLKQYNNQSYTIDYGMNYFPEKEYKGVIYEAGNYESLVVKLGDGLGENFWCILFPPLCLLDGEETEKSEIEYTSFIQEIINKYF